MTVSKIQFFHTRGRLITNELGNTPKKGDTIEMEPLRSEDVDVDYVLFNTLLISLKEYK